MKKLQQFLLAGLAAILVACPTPLVAPVITTFTATPETLPIGGGSSTLTWATTGAATLTIDQGVGVVTGTEKAITVTTTKSYILTATNSAGSVQKTVTITVATGKPVISAFTATPASLPIGGGSSTLAWTVAGADSLSIDKAVGTVTGTEKAVTVNATTTYTLTATNSLGSETKAVTVTVAQPVEPPANVISGTITPWTRGARVLKGISYTTSTRTLSEGTLDQAGVFNLTLPETISNLELLVSPTNTCASSLTVSPADTKGIGLSNIDINTALNGNSGSLVRANTNNIYSSPQAGRKLVSYVFVDRASTITGTCIVSGQTQLSDLNLKQGWNTMLLEYTNSTNLRVSSNAIPNDVTWRFIPSGTITITPLAETLEVGETRTLTATASDGYEFSNSELDWSSSIPRYAEISSSGVLTAKEIGTTRVNVGLKSFPSMVASKIFRTTGFFATGGTFNMENGTLATTIRISHASTGDFAASLQIRGPQGWNSDQPISVEFTRNIHTTTNFDLLTEIPVVSGTYTLRRASETSGEIGRAHV